MILLISLISLFTFALPPTNFDQYVFVDFTQVTYEVTYDVAASQASAKTTIEFTQAVYGKMLFDLIPEATFISIDGVETSMELVNSPDQETSYRSISTITNPGLHTLIIKNKFTKNVNFRGNTVRSAFWMSDLEDRQYLEQYLPTNLEFDQYKSTMKVNVLALNDYQLYSNGEVTKNANEFEIDFPDYFTASSFYFHLTPKGRFKELRFTHTPNVGNSFPVTIYASSSFKLDRAKKKTISVLKELNEKLGIWRHPALTIYIGGIGGGMEYSGATQTSMSALGHELTHSYFARGVLPQDGNAGWMDEAIASWRDKGYQATSSPGFSYSNMAAHSQYRRRTDMNAYSLGARFMAYLNGALQTQGGLITLLKNFHQNNVHQTVTTNDLLVFLNIFSSLRFDQDFEKYLYSADAVKSAQTHNPNHPPMSKNDYEALL